MEYVKRRYNNSTGEEIHANSHRRREKLRNSSVQNGQPIFEYPNYKITPQGRVKIPNNRANLNKLSKIHTE